MVGLYRIQRAVQMGCGLEVLRFPRCVATAHSSWTEVGRLSPFLHNYDSVGPRNDDRTRLCLLWAENPNLLSLPRAALFSPPPRSTSIPPMPSSFAFRRTLSLILVLAFLACIWLASTYQNHGLQYVHSVLDSIHSYYPTAWKSPLTPFPRGSDPTRGYWTSNTDHKQDSHLWDAGSCYDRTSELKNGQPIPGGFIDDGSRAEAIDSWEWVMEGGLRLREWDMDGFIARALQSRVGVFVVGGMIPTAMVTVELTSCQTPSTIRFILR
jgi:hypothetical protein